MPPLKHSRTEPFTHGSQDIQLAKSVASQEQLAASSESQHEPSKSESQLSAAGSKLPPPAASKAVAEMTKAMQRRMKVCEPKAKATTRKTRKDNVTKRPASSTSTSKTSKTLITHEASRKQFLVRIAGQSKAFSYKHGKSMNAAKREAEQFLAKVAKAK